jgi:hypothetical protein
MHGYGSTFLRSCIYYHSRSSMNLSSEIENKADGHTNVCVPAEKGFFSEMRYALCFFSRRQSRNPHLRRGLDSSCPSYFSLSIHIITYLKHGENIYRLKYVNLRFCMYIWVETNRAYTSLPNWSTRQYT